MSVQGKTKVKSINNLCRDEEYYIIKGMAIIGGYFIGSRGDYAYFAKGTDIFYVYDFKSSSVFLNCLDAEKALLGQVKGLAELLEEQIKEQIK